MRFGRNIVLGLLALCLGCGGGGSDEPEQVVGGGGGSTTLTVNFTPDQPNPGANTVSLGQQSIAAGTATLAVNLTDTNGVYGAGFDVVFDSTVVQFSSWTPGTALESGGQTVNYIVNQPVAGRLVVAISRQGNAPMASVSGTQPLIRLTFRALRVGSSTLAFQNAALVDDQTQGLAGINWAGGTLDAN